MDDALKLQVINTIDNTYLCKLRNKYTGYLGISARDLFNHLLDRYGKIMPADIETCKKRMNDPIDSTQPIDIYFQKVDDCVQYAADGQVTFTPGQILQTAYHAVSTSGYYNDACKEWRKRPSNDKTWLQFKRFFAAEYHDLKEQQKVNTNQSNFHGANAAVDISMALDNLALAASNDHDIVMQLTRSNEQLTTTNKMLTEQLQQALTTNATLVKNLALPPRRPPTMDDDHSTNRNGSQDSIRLDTVGPMAIVCSWDTTVSTVKANSPDIRQQQHDATSSVGPSKEKIDSLGQHRTIQIE